MNLILLGTGTSTGIPEVGCNCMHCQSSDPRDKRLRTSALLISQAGTRILIDCGPDFRQQANHIGLEHIDAIVLTHEHYDHVYGLDDLRTIAWHKEIPIYGQANVLDAVRNRMHYVFSPNPYPGTPKLSLNELKNGEVLKIKDLEVTPLLVMHGKLPIFGYRFHQVGTEHKEDICYITDMKSADKCEFSKIDNSRVLVINALRYQREHPSHQNVIDVLNLLNTLESKPERTILTHLSHHAPCYKELVQLLPQDDSILPGYDFACIEVGKEIEIHPFIPHHELMRQVAYPLDLAMLKSENISERTPLGLICASNDGSRASLDMQFAVRKDAFLGDLEELKACVIRSLHLMVGLYRMQAQEIDKCIRGLQAEETEDSLKLELSLGVNALDNTSKLMTMQDFCEGKNQDITVVKHFLSGIIYSEIQRLIKSIYKGSLSPINK